MANANWNINPWDVYHKDINDVLRETQHVIQGEMLVANFKITEFQKLSLDIGDSEAWIKKNLCDIISEHLLRSKHVLFTKREDRVTNGTDYLARAYLVPSDMVQILRQVK
tara:strand:+ start:576 stop:905 length:330 start_codon:yes stop_codon:yes gene_type:complete